MNPSNPEADLSGDSPVNISIPSMISSSMRPEVDCPLEGGLEPLAIIGMGELLPRRPLLPPFAHSD